MPQPAHRHVLLSSWSSRLPFLVLLGLLLGFSQGAHAQYRSNSLGLVLPLGPEPLENFPLTLAMFGGSELAWKGWEQLEKAGGPARNTAFKPCSQRKPYGFPCINNQFGLSDAVWGGVTYTHSLGDLILDVSENPLLRNLWIQYRGLVGMALTLAGRGKGAPVFLTHQEAGIKWNIMDEKIRPYIAWNAAFNLFVDPAGLYGSVQNNNELCQRQSQGEVINRPTGQGCGQTTDFSITNPSFQGVLNTFGTYSTAVPVSLSTGPEAGIEYFFFEDVSVQAYISPMVYLTTFPPLVFRVPYFANASMRAGLTFSTYW